MSLASIESPIEKVAAFFAHGPSQEEIATFHLSESAMARIHELLEKNALGTLTPEENEDLDQLVALDRIVTLIRSQLPTPEKMASEE